MSMNGRTPVALAWGEPRKRPFKGFLVRWFEWLNTTWPHAGHQLFNAGRDASSLGTILPCLFSHLPPRFDFLLVEFRRGSGARCFNFDQRLRWC